MFVGKIRMLDGLVSNHCFVFSLARKITSRIGSRLDKNIGENIKTDLFVFDEWHRYEGLQLAASLAHLNDIKLCL
jgi:hypothetical protein